jgi:hypothetical protein
MDRLTCLLCDEGFTFVSAQGRLIHLRCRHLICVACVKNLLHFRLRKCPFCRERVTWTTVDVTKYEQSRIFLEPF